MKKYLIILLMAMLPALALAQQAGGHITRPGKAKPKTEKPAPKPSKKQTVPKPPKKQSHSQPVGTGRALPESQPQPSVVATPPTPPKPTVSSYADSNGNKVFNIGNVQFTMIKVEGGTFKMGGTKEQGSVFNDEKPVHEVTLTSFFIGQTEVTQALWEIVMGNNPSNFKGDMRPVEKVSWNDCQEFVDRLNSLTGERFKLPTEAQWEYAARGGRKSLGYRYAGSNKEDEVAWYGVNSGNETHNVGMKLANELGLYDMSGNVFEWCSDWRGNYDSSMQTDPTGPTSGTLHVNRGGSWYYDQWRCRVSSRINANAPGYRGNDVGLRLAL